MFEEWRPLLYYPLGLLPSLFFTLRFLIQWGESEKKGRSVVSEGFWKLSLAGNILLLAHYVIQVQYPFALIQAANAAISWRNIRLMRGAPPCIGLKAIFLFGSSFMAVTALFLLQSFFVIGALDWVRTPLKLWDQGREHHTLLWHWIGFLGGVLFASRFLLQWWQAEKKGRSELSPSFFRISILGSIVSLSYFIKIEDTVSTISYAFGLIPYIRNLMIIKRTEKGPTALTGESSSS